jgi:hypothetical protein
MDKKNSTGSATMSDPKIIKNDESYELYWYKKILQRQDIGEFVMVQ